MILVLTVFATFKTIRLCNELTESLSEIDGFVEANDFPSAHRLVREFRELEDKAEVWFALFVDRNYIFEFQNNCASFESFINDEHWHDYLADSDKAKATLEVISDTMTQIF